VDFDPLFHLFNLTYKKEGKKFPWSVGGNEASKVKREERKLPSLHGEMMILHPTFLIKK
jgi:hypothetical protein